MCRPSPKRRKYSAAGSRRFTPQSMGVSPASLLHNMTHLLPGILSRDIPSDLADLTTNSISPITLVVCNLYPFVLQTSKPDCTLASAIEEIDIGGVTLLRAAAKNHARVSIISSPADYQAILDEWKEKGEVSEATKRGLALKAFESTKSYDEAIADYLRKTYASTDSVDGMGAGAGVGYQRLPLRYGANPHQQPAQAFVEQGDMPIKGASWCHIPKWAMLTESPSTVWLARVHQPARRPQLLGSR